MLLDKYKPLYAPDDETGAGNEQVTETPVETPEVETETPAEQPDGPGSGRSSLRKSLEKGFADNRRKEQPKAPKKSTRVAGGAEIEPTEVEEEISEGETPEGQETPQTAAPEAFSKEAKAEWAKTPANVQSAILKREADVQKGVDELKAKYKDIDTVLAPHMQAIRQNGHSPAQAVNQLFSWFQALSVNPDVAFPALAKSFGHDITKFVGAKPADTQQPQPQPTDPQTTPDWQKYLDDQMKKVQETVGQELTGFKTYFQQQNEAKTNEVLFNWSKDKPHFEEVRQLMAQFIQSGAVPLKNNQVDLDGAYEMALYANPEVRAKLLAEKDAAAEKARRDRAAAIKKKQEEEALKARRAGANIGGGAPGDAAPTGGKPKGRGKSVRESLLESLSEARE